MESVAEIEAKLRDVIPIVAGIREQVNKVIVGQHNMVDRLLIGMLCEGHVLLEGVPGLAKTTAVSSLAQAMHLEFKRIQFTPDLLPSDLLGTEVYNPTNGTFSTRRGPIFANIVLADEINRAPAKVQSALLEAMQERQVTLGDETHILPRPFLVLATQNPIEQEGTYPLPEAQADRFMLKIRVGYPTKDEEKEILRRASRASHETIDSVAGPDDLVRCREAMALIRVEQVVDDYVVELIHATRNAAKLSPELGRFIEFGASPRATIALAKAARAHAFLQGRGYVTPDDVKAMGPDVLRHRVLLTYEAEAEELSTEDVIERVFQQVKTP